MDIKVGDRVRILDVDTGDLDIQDVEVYTRQIGKTLDVTCLNGNMIECGDLIFYPNEVELVARISQDKIKAIKDKLVG